MRKTSISIAVALATFSATTYSMIPKTDTWYAGAKVGWSKYHGTKCYYKKLGRTNGYEDSGGAVHSSVPSKSLLLGYQLNPYLAVETGYDWLGRVVSSGRNADLSFKARGFELLVKGSYVIQGDCNIYTRLGAFMWIMQAREVNRTYDNKMFSDHDVGVSPFASVGVEYYFNKNWLSHLDFQWIEHIGNTQIVGVQPNNGCLNLGFTYRFNQNDQNYTKQEAPRKDLINNTIIQKPDSFSNNHQSSITTYTKSNSCFTNNKSLTTAHKKHDTCFTNNKSLTTAHKKHDTCFTNNKSLTTTHKKHNTCFTNNKSLTTTHKKHNTYLKNNKSLTTAHKKHNTCFKHNKSLTTVHKKHDVSSKDHSSLDINIQHFELKSKIMFSFNKDNLNSQNQQSLNKTFNKLKKLSSKEISVNILGFTDRIGSEQYNKNLSNKRACSVFNYVVSKDISPNKISVHALGSSNSVTFNNCNKIKNRNSLIKCLAPDRRVELSIKGIKK